MIRLSRGELEVPGLQSTYSSPISDCGRIAQVALAWKGANAGSSMEIVTAARLFDGHAQILDRSYVGPGDADVLPLHRERGVIEDRPHHVGDAAGGLENPVATTNPPAAHSSTAADEHEAPHGPGGTELVEQPGTDCGVEPSGDGCTALPGTAVVDHVQALVALGRELHA